MPLTKSLPPASITMTCNRQKLHQKAAVYKIRAEMRLETHSPWVEMVWSTAGIPRVRCPCLNEVG